MKMVVFKKGGEPGEVAINPAQVTHVRTGSGAFTDVYYGAQRVAVVGTFEHVVAKLSGELEGEGHGHHGG
jgi:hypothetical protein